MYMSAAPLTKAGAGRPLDCFNTCNQHFTGNTNFNLALDMQ